VNGVVGLLCLSVFLLSFGFTTAPGEREVCRTNFMGVLGIVARPDFVGVEIGFEAYGCRTSLPFKLPYDSGPFLFSLDAS